MEEPLNDSQNVLEHITSGQFALLVKKSLGFDGKVTEARLFPNQLAAGHKKLQAFEVTNAAAEKMLADYPGSVLPLSQYACRNRIGWRNVVGDQGERYDVYLMSC